MECELKRVEVSPALELASVSGEVGGLHRVELVDGVAGCGGGGGRRRRTAACRLVGGGDEERERVMVHGGVDRRRRTLELLTVVVGHQLVRTCYSAVRLRLAAALRRPVACCSQHRTPPRPIASSHRPT